MCEAPGGLFKAIKFVYGNLNSVDCNGVRAEQEKKALERIREVRHPFVCSVERMEFVEGELMIVMELADRTLHDKFVECQSLGHPGIPANELMRYMRDVAEALDYMYTEHKLQHLDVKPRNLFLIGDRVKVADFGLVKGLDKTGNSAILGGVTPLYAPPETFRGVISPQSDQYSLAIVYQELLTGVCVPIWRRTFGRWRRCTWKRSRTFVRCRRWSGRWWPRRCRRTRRSVIRPAWRFSPLSIKPAHRSGSSMCGRPAAGRTGERFRTPWRTCSCRSSTHCPPRLYGGETARLACGCRRR